MKHLATILGTLMPVLVASLPAQQALPVGAGASGTTAADAPASFHFVPPSAGVLTIVVRGNDDLGIVVTDEDGQAIPEGQGDVDHNGSTGLEFLVVPLSGTDPVVVSVQLVSDAGGEGAFAIRASFIAEEGFARPSDPDRRPSLAGAVTIGQASEQSLDPDAGDAWDWFRITANEAMTVAIVTRMAEGTDGDLVLEAFADGDYSEAIARSDQDLQGHTGNESVTVDLKAGQVVHVRVSTLWQTGGQSPYRLSVGRVP